MKFLLRHHRLFEGHGGYDLVAEVETEAVGDVFSLSQHRGEHRWMQNPGV